MRRPHKALDSQSPAPERTEPGAFDGPPSCPALHVDVTLPSADGKTIRVRANDNFQEALERRDSLW